MATIPTITQWTAGTQLTAALMNANVYQIGNLVLNRPRTRVYLGTAYGQATLAGTTYNNVSMTSVTVDSDGMFSSSNPTVLTVATPGIWMVGGQVQFAWNVTGQRGLKLFQNGTNLIAGVETNATTGASGTIGTTLSATGTFQLAVGDTIGLALYQNSGSTITISAGNTNLWATWLGS